MNALLVGAISGMTAVALSAFGAHALEGVLSERAMETFQTAADYQFYHSLALVLVALLGANYPNATKLKWSAGLFALGIVLFSGSLYLLSLSGIRWLGMVTPFGGVSFILGWLILAFFAARDYSRT
ncbi:DUF423 domain-containing protein [Salinisphaera sp. G21_0]|uniref:DUF423 domain-containing protein n=1 Tax=Salinisphaera sp. G21_0 TaxID=2821094 RepID=UPI001B25B7FE|nr:DUF423 domain-containing protein [Salinisphaera sp. G21_0]MBO9481777.1 DUF423 domain-containing protein [Salinisphaera sp. G21_0]